MLSQFHVIWSIMRGNRGRYAIALGCLAVATVVTFLVPLVGSATLDYAVVGQSVTTETPALLRGVLRALGGPAFLRAHLWLAPMAMVGLALLAGVFSYLKSWQAALASEQIARRLRDDLYDHLNHLPARYHDQAGTGDLVQRCTSDVETTRQFLATQVLQLGHAALLAGAALPLLLTLDRPMTLVSFALIGPLVVYGYVYFRRIKHVFREIDESEGALTAVIQENLTGIRVVRAFARQEFERARLAVPNARFRDRNLHMLRLMSWYWSISDFAALCQLGLTLIVGAHWIAEGRLTVGLLFAFTSYLSLVLWPVREMGRVLTELGKTSVALSRIGEILGVPRELDAPPAGAPSLPHRLTGAIAVRDLHFAHAGTSSTAPGAGALNGLSFDVAPGETLAILGPSGAGKSTLIHLLLRLYDYTEGSIRVDGHELSQLPRSWVRGQVGSVMQEPFLFSKTLGDNLRLGASGAAEHEIHEAARVASIHDTILSFEQGYATLVGERGINLSGGQRQRMAIARAVLKRPPILILDDALSAVDSETEAAILAALESRRGSATTLVIAHRLATLSHADRILVLDHGRIIQTGTHAQLAATEGLYRRLWQIQTSLESELPTA